MINVCCRSYLVSYLCTLHGMSERKTKVSVVVLNYLFLVFFYLNISVGSTQAITWQGYNYIKLICLNLKHGSISKRYILSLQNKRINKKTQFKTGKE